MKQGIKRLLSVVLLLVLIGGLFPAAHAAAGDPPGYYIHGTADEAAGTFELAVYGAVTGILNRVLPDKEAFVYVSLAGAMIAGRLVWGIVSIPLYGVAGKAFSWQIFMGGALLNAVPGIILQLVLIPVIIMSLKRAKVME